MSEHFIFTDEFKGFKTLTDVSGIDTINAAAVTDRLFSLFIFMHVGVPLLMLFGLWFHIQRLTRAAVFPPRALALAASRSAARVQLASTGVRTQSGAVALRPAHAERPREHALERKLSEGV